MHKQLVHPKKYFDKGDPYHCYCHKTTRLISEKYSDIKIFELTNISTNETLSRTLITSITTLLALLSIFFFGGEILKGFSLAMIFGVIFGTYSSIYIANTVLVRLNVSQKTILKEDTEV